MTFAEGDYQAVWVGLRAGLIKPSPRALRVIEWVEANMRVPDGARAGQPMVLTAHQKLKLSAIFHFPDRLPRRVLISEARKNAKTALCAIIVTVFIGGPEARPQLKIVSTARSREQAAILHGYAKASRDMSPSLGHIRTKGKELFVPAWGTQYKALSSDASRNIGQSPAIAIHDELGEVEGPTDDLYSAIETGMMAHANPMSIIISTQARNDTDLLSTLIDDMKHAPQPGDLLVLYEADVDLYSDANALKGLPGPYSIEAIRAANPELGVLQNEAEVLRLAMEAKRLPSLDGQYRNRNLNQRVSPFASFVSQAAWRDGARPGLALPPKDVPVFLGLDLSEVNDLTGLAAVWEEDGNLCAWARGWIPEEALAERSRKDRVPYDVWAKAGVIQTVPGKAIDYDFVADQVVPLFSSNRIHAAGFDRWGWRHFKKSLKAAGLPAYLLDETKDEHGKLLTGKWYPVGMGTTTMTPVLRYVEELLLGSRLLHPDLPPLNMCAMNAAVAGDAEARRLSKRNSRARIDIFMALVIACAAKLEAPPVPKISEDFRIL